MDLGVRNGALRCRRGWVGWVVVPCDLIMKRGEGDRDDHNGETTERLRILCLHGKHQCGEIFSQKVRALTKKAKGLATFAFVDAPFALPLRDGQSVPMRTWSNSTVPKHQQWDRSLHMVTELVEKHSYDGILSFSQGAFLPLDAPSSSFSSRAHRPSLSYQEDALHLSWHRKSTGMPR